jgi:hypothetical protein
MKARYLPLALPIAATVLAAGLVACQGCRSGAAGNAGNAGGASAPTGGTSGAAAEPGPPTARLYFVTDLAGALEPCGCTRDQLGGLDHFGAWIQAARATAPASVVASAGPLFFRDEKLDPEEGEQDRIKASAIAQVLKGLSFVALAPGANDWAAGRDALSRLASTAGATVLVPDGDAGAPYASEVVRDVGGLRVGFVGYGQPESGKPPPGDAEAAVAREAQQAKAQGASVLVALVSVGRGEAKRIADAVPELAAVVVGSARASGETNTTAPEGELVGSTLIVQAANHLQSVAVLDVYAREPVVPGHLLQLADGSGMDLAQKRAELARRIDDLHVKISAWEREPRVNEGDVAARRQDLAKLEAEREALDRPRPPARGSFFRYFVKEIRESLGKDESVDQAMASYYKAVNDHNREAFAGRLPPPAPAGQASYVGIEVCSSCHPGPRQVWNGTRHAHAYESLSSQFKQFNLECVGCHVTGYERPGGSTVTHVDKLENVQCEVCHGPGSQHVADPKDLTKIITSPPVSTCLACHHSPHVEGFDPNKKITEILGPGHGRPAQ